MKTLPDRTGVLVVGTGSTGLGTALALRRSAVCDRRHDITTTARDRVHA